MAPLKRLTEAPPEAPEANASAGRTPWLRAAIALSLALFAMRLHIASKVGFADAEALYACYALHPQPGYLDHPGLIGLVMRWLGRGGAPDPHASHMAAAVLATLVPWLGGAAARCAGAKPAGAVRTVLALALAPEIAIGLFAMSPDLLLAALWLAALAAAALAARSEPGSSRALYAMLAAGALLGLAILAKVSALLLAAAFAVSLFSKPLRAHLRTFAPWGALLLTSILVAPLVAWEVRRGYPMLTHRLISTQRASGFSLRNLAALIGGQIAYVGPPLLLAAALVARAANRARSASAVDTLLWNTTWIPGVFLAVLCAWSRVAEPHWLAPAYLALAIAAGRQTSVGPRLARSSAGLGVALALFAWAWVATSLPPRLLGSAYRGRYDLANDLYAWGPARKLLAEVVDDTIVNSERLPVVVGPHYTVCAQVHAALGRGIPVGCNGPLRDDFDDWLPRHVWLDAPVVLYVEDDRFDLKPNIELPNRVARSVSTASIRRGDVVVRTIRITRLDKLSDAAERGTRAPAHARVLKPELERAAPPPR